MSSGGIFQAATHAAMGRYQSAWERCEGGAHRAGGMCELVAMLLTAFQCSPETLQRQIFISCGIITYLFHTTCVFCLLIFPYYRKDLHADLYALSHEFVSSMVPPAYSRGAHGYRELKVLIRVPPQVPRLSANPFHCRLSKCVTFSTESVVTQIWTET